MDATYSDLIRSRRNKDIISVEHHYKVDVFMATMDQQLQELNSRFSEKTTELLILSNSLNPIGSYKHFNIDNIYVLVEKYYPEDFSNDDKFQLRFELQLFYRYVVTNEEMKNLSYVNI